MDEDGEKDNADGRNKKITVIKTKMEITIMMVMMMGKRLIIMLRTPRFHLLTPRVGFYSDCLLPMSYLQFSIVL